MTDTDVPAESVSNVVTEAEISEVQIEFLPVEIAETEDQPEIVRDSPSPKRPRLEENVTDHPEIVRDSPSPNRPRLEENVTDQPEIVRDDPPPKTHPASSDAPPSLPSPQHPAVSARATASINLKKQAEKMVKRTNKKLAACQVGDCVTIPIPEFDRGRGDPANIIGVVMAIKNDQYKLGTKVGIIDVWFSRNGFESVKFRGLTPDDVPDVKLTVREAVRKQSVGTGQGYERCNCKKSSCRTGRCRCLKSNVKCNSACHPGISCENHD